MFTLPDPNNARGIDDLPTLKDVHCHFRPLRMCSSATGVRLAPEHIPLLSYTGVMRSSGHFGPDA
jgi:hypothetical protein